MEKVIIDLREIQGLENNLYLEDYSFEKETGFTNYKLKGTLTVPQDVLAQVLGGELKYQIEELGNLMVEWDFDYPGLEVEGSTGWEVMEVLKFQDGKVYFKVV